MICHDQTSEQLCRNICLHGNPICLISVSYTHLCIQHRLTGCSAVILHQLARYAEPLTILKCRELCLRVCMQLLGNILHLSGLDVESALVDVRGAEGTYAWLVALSGCRYLLPGNH